MPGATVSVACKIPHGLVIQHEQLVETKGTDGAVARTYVRVGAPITLAGANTARVIGGYGITDNIDADFFAKWLESEKGSALLNPGNPLVFATATHDKAEAQAKDLAATKTGLEPLKQDAPMPGIEKADK